MFLLPKRDVSARKIGVRQTEQLLEVFFFWLFDSHKMTLRPTSNLVTPVGDQP
jgi:hypothetical protein